jgi:hypothetical protein
MLLKKYLIVVFIVLTGFTFTATNPIENCGCRGIPLYGKVKVVKHFADFKIQVVEHFPDLKVQKVQHFPDKCGKWQFVEHFPDFTIRYVEHFPDFKIKYVDHHPGLP